MKNKLALSVESKVDFCIDNGGIKKDIKKTENLL